MKSKSNSLWLAVLLGTCCITAHAQSSNADSKARTNLAYGGGGIRGNMVVLPAVADGVLVTAQESRDFEGEKGYYEPLPLRPRSMLPSIDILKPVPAADLKVKAPFPISVQFRAQDAAIVPGSFRVYYGALKVDITERITKYVQVTPEGFTLEQAKIPVGKHRLTLHVADEKQRVAERELRVEVE